MQEVTLQFYLEEEVTPKLFAEKVARALARGGALRKGERVSSGVFLYEYTGDARTSMRELGLGKSQADIQVPIIEEIHASAQVEK